MAGAPEKPALLPTEAGVPRSGFMGWGEKVCLKLRSLMSDDEFQFGVGLNGVWRRRAIHHWDGLFGNETCLLLTDRTH